MNVDPAKVSRGDYQQVSARPFAQNVAASTAVILWPGPDQDQNSTGSRVAEGRPKNIYLLYTIIFYYNKISIYTTIYPLLQ
jgi:hypothetical protein